MKGHVIVSHGLQSGPDSSKAVALAEVARRRGWSVQLGDYRDLDLIGRLGDVQGRIARLREAARANPGPLVLAGSSMGAFVSARVSLEVPVRGLFLMSPPPALEGHEIRLDAAAVPIRVVHGWDDELIDARQVFDWARARKAGLSLVDDSHRLSAHVDFCAAAFDDFLAGLE
jgi:pimeloyl-ACP methyl ester carboxylesterase